MRKTIDYLILTSGSTDDLVTLVNNKLEVGYELVGVPFFAAVSSGSIFCQAMAMYTIQTGDN